MTKWKDIFVIRMKIPFNPHIKMNILRNIVTDKGFEIMSFTCGTS